MLEDCVDALRRLQEVAIPDLEMVGAVAETQQVDDDTLDIAWKIRVLIERVALTLRDKGLC